MTFDLLPSNMTAEDVIREYRVCGDPVIEHLCVLLGDTLDLNKDLEADLTEAERRVDEAAEDDCPECDRLEMALDQKEDRIIDLGEQLNHERSRVEEFSKENSALRAEIETLKTGGRKSA